MTAYKIVPAHIAEDGYFCSGGGLGTVDGRCQNGCDHAEHYSNDGHPECEDLSGEPGHGQM